MSGPLVDRLDVHVPVPPVDVAALIGMSRGEPSSSVRARVLAARERQRERGAINSALGPRALERVARPSADAERLIETAISQLGLSARAYVKVLRVARTIADLDGSERVRAPHVAEALQGRLLDRDPLA